VIIISGSSQARHRARFRAGVQCGRALRAVLLSLSLVIGLIEVPARAAEAIDVQAADSLMLSLMATYGVPGAALALIQDGHVVLTKGYGFRDLASHLPVTEHTLFNIGSITKSFTSVDIAQLVDQGRLDLDRPVAQYVPELRLSDRRVTRTVTLRQLLSHTSGLPRHDDWFATVPASRQQILRDMVKIPVSAEPGTRFQYCNQNYVLAGYVLERVTGQSWEAYTRSHIFAPLGMRTASFGPLGLEHAQDRAQPYWPDVWLGETPVPWTNNGLQALQALGPAGSIDASIDDMAQYAVFHLGDGTASGQQLISPHMLAEMHRPQITLAPGPLTRHMAYGLGWSLEEYRGVRLVSHGGEITGFSANVTLVPADKAGVVILTNAHDAGLFLEAARLSLVEQILNIAPRHDLAAEVNAAYHVDLGQRASLIAEARTYRGAAADNLRWAGDYDGPWGRVAITATQNGLALRGLSGQLAIDTNALGNGTVELNPTARDMYFSSHTYGTIVRFSTGADGVTTLYAGQVPIANRVDTPGRDGIYQHFAAGFRVMAPTGVHIARAGATLVFRSMQLGATVVLTVVPSKVSRLDAEIDHFVAGSMPGFPLEAIVRSDLGDLPGRRAVYRLPGAQYIVILAMRERDRVLFFTIIEGMHEDPDVPRLLNFMLLSFRLI
jgi:CubicO group peptidase (beta-lactamase class C family)